MRGLNLNPFFFDRIPKTSLKALLNQCLLDEEADSSEDAFTADESNETQQEDTSILINFAIIMNANRNALRNYLSSTNKNKHSVKTKTNKDYISNKELVTHGITYCPTKKTIIYSTYKVDREHKYSLINREQMEV